jgi:hypothetical protein
MLTVPYKAACKHQTKRARLGICLHVRRTKSPHTTAIWSISSKLPGVRTSDSLATALLRVECIGLLRLAGAIHVSIVLNLQFE